MAKDGDEQKQQKAILFQLLQQRLAELQNQTAAIQDAYVQVKSTQEGLSSMSSMKEDDQIIIPFGSEVFARAKASDTKSVLVNVGSDIILEKTVEQAQKFVSERLSEIEQAAQKVSSEMEQVVHALNDVMAEMN